MYIYFNQCSTLSPSHSKQIPSIQKWPLKFKHFQFAIELNERTNERMNTNLTVRYLFAENLCRLNYQSRQLYNSASLLCTFSGQKCELIWNDFVGQSQNVRTDKKANQQANLPHLKCVWKCCFNMWNFMENWTLSWNQNHLVSVLFICRATDTEQQQQWTQKKLVSYRTNTLFHIKYTLVACFFLSFRSFFHFNREQRSQSVKIVFVKYKSINQKKKNIYISRLTKKKNVAKQDTF